MLTLSSLPPECLEVIIRQLARQQDTVTLAKLLRVNRYICNATLPILYQNPFEIIVPFSTDTIRQSSLLENLTKLVRVLLLSLAEHHNQLHAPSHLLHIAYLMDQTPAATTSKQEGVQLSTKPLFHYSSFITKISFDSCTIPQHGVFHNFTLSSNPAFTDYLDTSPTDPYLVMWGLQGNMLVEAAGRALQRDLTWALCVNAERIQSLVMPLSDIDRYLSLAHRFEALSHVLFLLDCQFIPNWIIVADDDDGLLLQQASKTQWLEKMILFVQEHKQKHGATLRTARCRGRYEDEIIPEEFKQRLFQLLRPLTDPRHLDDSNWDQFLANFQETDLSFVRDISPGLGYGDDAAMDRLVKKGPFLQRCRSLDSFIMDSPGDNVFQWAVDERMSYDADIAAGRTPQTPLVPLRVFNVSCYHKTLGRQLNDVVFAFGKTLEIISISCRWKPEDGNNHIDSNDDQGEQSDFRVGGDDGDSFAGWDLPRLTRLHLSMQYSSSLLRIAPDLLTRLLQLTHLTLIDRRHEYKPSEIVSWVPVGLPDLVDLQLEGTSAISFNPETLRSARNLVRMEFRMSNPRYHRFCFVPTAEELEASFAQPGDETMTLLMPSLKRPIWTWDWDLPKLTTLFLNGEFGCRFQFRMLAGTPNLMSFQVDSRSSASSGQHERTIVLSDLLMPGFDHPSLASILDQDRQFQEAFAASEANKQMTTARQEGDVNHDKDVKGEREATAHEAKGRIWDDFEYLTLPVLDSFALRGTWTMSRRTLAVLFARVAPNVKYLTIQGSRGYDGMEWVELSWEYLLSLEEAVSSVRVDPEMMAEAGLTKDTLSSYSRRRVPGDNQRVAYRFI